MTAPTTAPHRSSAHRLPLLATVCVLAASALALACGDTDPRPPAADTGTGLDVGDSACGPGARLCDGTCAALLSDEVNCGDCGVVCDSSEVCEDGRCACPENTERCGRACVSTLSSPEHCGACGTPCGVGEVCQSGACALQCTGGDVPCSGGCVDTDSSAAHCGACDRPCTAGVNETATCSEGACVRRCDPDWYDVDGLRGCEYFCAPTLDGPEICDGEDNDCDGLVDDADPEYEAPLCPLQDGVCAGATARCVDGSLRECDALDYADQAAPRPWNDAFETWCDGLDNDCNGLADDTCCLPADLPIGVPAVVEPPNIDSYAVFTAYPLLGAPRPALITPALMTRGGDASSWIDLITFPSQGGLGNRVALFGGPVGDLDVAFLDAIWNDEVVVYVRYLASGIVARRAFALSGEFAGETTLTLAEGVGTVRDLVARPLDDGDELILMIGDDGGSKRAWAARVGDGAVEISELISGTLTNPEAIDIVPTDTGARACVFVPEREVPIVCYPVDHELTPVAEGSELPGTPSPQIRPAFARAGTNWIYHHPTEDGTRVLATTIAADGTVSQTDSSMGTQEGFVVGGAITSGELGLLTLREKDADVGLYRVDFTVPSRGASVIASYEGKGVAPAAVVSAVGSSYVVVHARRYDPELVSQRPYAFPISREGDALCLED